MGKKETKKGFVKRLIGFTLSFSLMFGTLAMPGAAAANDISNAKVAKAVEKLMALDIVNGYEDGTYRPENIVTREEFAKLIVVALGLSDAAAVSAGNTPFADIAKDRWSAGYVAVASGKGIIKGYPDGTFMPTNTVTYAEAVTMLVRALGYRDEWLAGTWPSNMVNKGNEIGMLKGIIMSGGNGATRGNVALLFDNSIDCHMVVQTGYGSDMKFEEDKEETFLSSKLEITKLEDQVITAVPAVDSSLDSNEIKLDDTAYEVASKAIAKVADVNALLGKKADVLVNDDDQVVYFDFQDEDLFVSGTIVEIDGTTITVQNADGSEDEYDLASEVDYVVNNDTTAGVGDLAQNQYGTFRLNDDDEIEFVNLYEFGSTSPLLVTEVSASGKFVKGYAQGSDNETKISYKDEDGIYVMGAVSNVADIAKGDLVYGITGIDHSSDSYCYLMVVRNTVAGELTRTNAAKSVLKIDGEDYDVASTATVSADANDTIEALDASSTALEDLIGEDVVAYIDAKGEVRHIVGQVESASSVMFGIVTKLYTNGSGDATMKVYLPENDDQLAYVYDSGDFTPVVNKPVMFKLDSDGEVDELAVMDGVATALEDMSVAADTDITQFNEDYDYFKTATQKVYVNNDTLFVDFTDTDEPTVVAWDDVKGKTVTAITSTFAYENTEAKFVVFGAGFEGLTSDYELAIVNDTFYDGDDKAELDVIGKDADETKVLDGVTLTEGDVIVYSTNQNGEITEAAVAIHNNTTQSALAGDFDAIYGTVDSFSNDVITFANGFTTTDSINLADDNYKLQQSIEVYVLTLDDSDEYDTIAKGDLADIDEDDSVVVIFNEDGEPSMVVVVE